MSTNTIKTRLACAFLIFAGCDSRPLPTAPGGANQRHILGIVTDEVRRPLSGAAVRLLDAPMAGVPSATTDAAGRFELFSTAAGTASLRVTHEGFASVTYVASWQPLINGGIEVIRLRSMASQTFRFDPGDYTATISIDG
jgi:hypothetical protein